MAGVLEYHPIFPAVLGRCGLTELSDLLRRRHFQLCSVLLHQQIRILLLVIEDLGFVCIHHQVTEAEHAARSGCLERDVIDVLMPAGHHSRAVTVHGSRNRCEWGHRRRRGKRRGSHGLVCCRGHFPFLSRGCRGREKNDAAREKPREQHRPTYLCTVSHHHGTGT